jgi:hypothetical protein
MAAGADRMPVLNSHPHDRRTQAMTSSFDRRIKNTPPEWRGPLVEVVDTAEAIHLAMKGWGIESPELLLGLTRLAVERFDAAKTPRQQD